MTFTGHISREHTIWCGNCSRWERVARRTIPQVKKWAKVNGWKMTKATGWTCPACLSARTEDMTNE